MRQKQIMLNTINDIKTMQSIIGKYDVDIDIIHERNVVDAKSFMGVASLDLSNPVIMLLHTDDEHIAAEIFKKLESEGI